jgi:hypothetical protein
VKVRGILALLLSNFVPGFFGKSIELHGINNVQNCVYYFFSYANKYVEIKFSIQVSNFVWLICLLSGPYLKELHGSSRGGM